MRGKKLQSVNNLLGLLELIHCAIIRTGPVLRFKGNRPSEHKCCGQLPGGVRLPRERRAKGMLSSAYNNVVIVLFALYNRNARQ
jgi:hypothetical protein